MPTYLCTGKFMVSSNGGRVPIESWLAILSVVVWELMEVKVSCFIGFAQFLRTGGSVVHLHFSVSEPLLDKEFQEM